VRRCAIAFPADPRPSPDRATTPLVGREREQAILHEHLDAALAGQGGLVLISGEAGIGKTALADAICRGAEEHGGLVLGGHCYDLSETPPYGPWSELFRRYQPTNDLPPPPAAFTRRDGVGAVANQSALFGQVQGFIDTLSARRPLVMILEDLHWADPASLELLRVLARGLGRLPVLMIATYRVGEVAASGHLEQYLPAIIHETNTVRVGLQRLGPDAVRAYVNERLPLPEADVQRLVAYLLGRGGGNPFFIGELLRTLEEEGILRDNGGGWELGDLRNARVPPLVRQVIAARLARVGAPARRLLAIGAIIGQDVPLALWMSVAEEAEEIVLPVIERAMEAYLVEASTDPSRVRFVHALIRETLAEGTSLSQRRRWHRRAGEILAARPDPDPDAVAYHFRQAGDGRAVAWLIAAGDRARHAFALATAAERYESALSLMEERDTDPVERAWLLYRVALVRRFATPRRCIGYIDEAARIAAATGNRPLAAVALQQAGLLHIFCGDLGRGIADLVRSVEHLGALSRDDRAELAKAGLGSLDLSAVRGLLTLNFAFAGRFAEALAVGEQFALQTGASHGHGFGVAYTYAKLGRPAEAERMFAKARAIYRAQGHHFLHALSAFMELRWVRLAYHADRIAEREQLAVEAEVALTQASDAGYHSSPRFAHAPLFFLAGRWDAVHVDALAAFSEGITGWRDNAMAMLGLVTHARGDTDLAWSLIRDALPDGPQTPPGNWHFTTGIEMQRLAAALTIESGDLDDARGWLEAHDRWLVWSGDRLDRADGHLLWAAYHRAIGDMPRATAHAQQALSSATAPCQPLTLLTVHRLLGELDTESGRFTDAASHLDQALHLADACAAPYERALTLLSLAALHGARGNRTDVSRALAGAREICAPLGAQPALARAEALGARLAVPSPPRQRHPDGLTMREVEVLRLIARGKSNQEIADALSMSVRTAERHISNIYGKAGARGRAEATAYAFRHDLT